MISLDWPPKCDREMLNGAKPTFRVRDNGDDGDDGGGDDDDERRRKRKVE